MSSVRMCDRCGTVFSELSEGWSSGTETQYKTNVNTGIREQVTAAVDTCGDCNEVRLARPKMLPQMPVPE